MGKMAVLLTYSEVYREQKRLEDLHALLQPLSFYSVLIALGKINAVMRTWVNAPDMQADRKVCAMLFGADSARVDLARRRFETAVAFTRMTALYVCRQAAVACGVEGRTVNDPETFLRVGQACLVANDLFYTLRFGEDSPLRDKAASLIPFSNYIGRDDYVNAIGRVQIMLRETLALLRIPGHPDHRSGVMPITIPG